MGAARNLLARLTVVERGPPRGRLSTEAALLAVTATSKLFVRLVVDRDRHWLLLSRFCNRYAGIGVVDLDKETIQQVLKVLRNLTCIALHWKSDASRGNRRIEPCSYQPVVGVGEVRRFHTRYYARGYLKLNQLVEKVEVRP